MHRQKTVVLYPGLSVSHFVPMVQLADALLEKGYSVVVAVIDITTEVDTTFAAAIDRAVSSNPSVTFHKLPRVQDPPALTHGVQFLIGYLALIRSYSQRFHDFLSSMAPGSVHAVIVDMGSVAAVGVTKNLGIPVYVFYPMGASALAVFLQLPSIRTEGQPSFKELGDALLSFHGVPPMPASHLLAELLEAPESEVYKLVATGFSKNLEANGILVNTFASLEPRAIGALMDPRLLLLPTESTMPPVYPVGPLVMGAAGEAGAAGHECIAWLDEQPEHSVVFLCFGSVMFGAKHSKEQLKEIAIGLERSGHRFLWVVRAPPHDDDPGKPLDPRADTDLDAILPEGFLERTHGRGLVVKLWAPQVDVLHQRATGAFVTHCGWNSVLEGVTAGVPMICWPLYSEQKMNKVFMVEEYGVGVEMVGWQQSLVKAEEVEAKVRLVMESEEGERLRARVKAQKDAAAMAWKDGGSSRMAFGQFLSHAAASVRV
ncbi:hypothetical protein U9M48_044647 [Paspalum notatum var. saurae]|uniref:Glycosyltransferase n=1 Tax=Paspalum notatum var. saurae TaxID=547442 RepID=A0AAQ3XIS5_PASNO